MVLSERGPPRSLVWKTPHLVETTRSRRLASCPSTTFPLPPASSSFVYTMPVIEKIKHALHLDSPKAAPASSSTPASTSTTAPAGDAVPATSTHVGSPAYKSSDLTVLFVLGGPGVGASSSFALRHVPESQEASATSRSLLRAHMLLHLRQGNAVREPRPRLSLHSPVWCVRSLLSCLVPRASPRA